MTQPRSAAVLVAVVGGSGSGKTWLAERLEKALAPHAIRISLDDFYRDRGRLSPARRATLNFDHPRSIDWAGFEGALQALASRRGAEIPDYDFSTHCRRPKTRVVRPSPIVIVDGLWLLRRPSVRKLFAFSIFLEAPARVRLARRLARDEVSRGRTEASIRRQFRETVEPMHRRFVESQAQQADIVLESCPLSSVNRLAGFIRRLAGF